MMKFWSIGLLLVMLASCCFCQLGLPDIALFESNNAASTAGGKRFEYVLGTMGAFNVLFSAFTFVVQSTFNYSDAAVPRKNMTKITLDVDDIRGIAYTIGTGTEREIHLSAQYVGNYKGDVVEEIKGILYHEMAHVWQWDGRGTAPGWLIEGIADFVRLKAGLAPSHWVKAGQGHRWDQGYDVTARFLDYCNDLSGGFVSRLNAKLATSTWSDHFFVDFLGKSVSDLWYDYKRKFSG